MLNITVRFTGLATAYIKNGNEGQKPTVGQIFRIWREVADGQRWVNACWYYHPEQTVHRYDKLFFENEVVKSGQYRDHLVDEIIEKCYVMFFTRYRHRVIGNKSVYCCESRYNEHEKTFNKIRTWKASSLMRCDRQTTLWICLSDSAPCVV